MRHREGCCWVCEELITPGEENYMVHGHCTNIKIPDEKPIELVKFEARIAKLEALVNEMSRSGKSKRRK